jgi:hypothetical protein
MMRLRRAPPAGVARGGASLVRPTVGRGAQLAGRSLFSAVNLAVNLAVNAVPLRSASMGSVAAPRATASGPRRPSSIEVWAKG